MMPTPQQRLRRYLAALLAAGGIGATALAPSAFAQSQTLEYPIKAAFLFKFGEFAEWPADAFAVSGGVLNICIVGDSGFAGIVSAAIKDETVAGRKVAARALASIAPTDPCHIAYLAGSAKQTVDEALQAVSGRPVLTITDESRAPATGVIHFVIRSNRVRFAIDDRAAAANGLTLRSALLSIAVSVQRRN
jgi:hypothetical protein